VSTQDGPLPVGKHGWQFYWLKGGGDGAVMSVYQMGDGSLWVHREQPFEKIDRVVSNNGTVTFEIGGKELPFKVVDREL
jgi:hypothetical protein